MINTRFQEGGDLEQAGLPKGGQGGQQKSLWVWSRGRAFLARGAVVVGYWGRNGQTGETPAWGTELALICIWLVTPDFLSSWYRYITRNSLIFSNYNKGKSFGFHVDERLEEKINEKDCENWGQSLSNSGTNQGKLLKQMLVFTGSDN